MATWSTTVTNKGTALQAKQTSGAKLTFTRVVSSSTYIPAENLKEQTEIINIAQTLSMENVKLNGNQYTITVFLTNGSLAAGYSLSQIGFYASDPDEGEILFAIAQIDTMKSIPSRTDAPGYGIEFAFTFQNANNATIEITPDMAGYMTREAIEQLVSDSVDAYIELGTAIDD